MPVALPFPSTLRQEPRLIACMMLLASSESSTVRSSFFDRRKHSSLLCPATAAARLDNDMRNTPSRTTCLQPENELSVVCLPQVVKETCSLPSGNSAPGLTPTRVSSSLSKHIRPPPLGPSSLKVITIIRWSLGMLNMLAMHACIASIRPALFPLNLLLPVGASVCIT